MSVYDVACFDQYVNYIAIYFEADEDEEEDELEAAASLSLIMCCSVMRIVTTISLYSG